MIIANLFLTPSPVYNNFVNRKNIPFNINFSESMNLAQMHKFDLFYLFIHEECSLNDQLTHIIHSLYFISNDLFKNLIPLPIYV